MLWNIFFGENEFCAPFNKWIYACNMISDIKKFKLKFLKQQNCNILVWPQLKNKHECKYLTDLRKKCINGISFFFPKQAVSLRHKLVRPFLAKQKVLGKVYRLCPVELLSICVQTCILICRFQSRRNTQNFQIYRKRELQWMNHYCLRYIHVGI